MNEAARSRSELTVRLGGAAAACAAGMAVVYASSLGWEWQAVMAVAGAIVLGLAWHDERIALTVFALSFATIFHPDLRFKVADLWIPAPAAVAGLILLREMTRRTALAVRRPSDIPLAPLGLLFAGLVASGMAAANQTAYAAGLAKWATHAAIFAAMVAVLRKESWIFNLADGLALIVAAVGTYGLYRVISGQSYDIDVLEGVASRAGSAQYFTALLPLMYARFAATSARLRIGRAAVCGVLISALMFTYTRAGWVASGLGLVVAAGRRARAHVWIAFALAVVVAVAPQDVRDRFASIFVVRDIGVDARLGSSTPAREGLLRIGVAVIRDNWLLGVGLGNYRGPTYFRYAVPGSVPVAHTPHNSWIYLWAEAGLLALAGFAWFYGSQVWKVWRALQAAAGEARATLLGFLGSFVAMAVIGCFQDDLNLMLTWVLLGMGAALAGIVRRGEG